MTGEFKPTTKEKWVLDRLKREGWVQFHEWEFGTHLYWKNYDLGFSLRLSRYNPKTFDYGGVRIEYRPKAKPQLHFHWYFSWPTKKNWPEFSECINLIQHLNESIRIYQS